MSQKKPNNLILVKDRFKNIIRSSLDTILKNANFKKRSAKYQLQGKKLIYEVSVQKSKWSSAAHISFTINFDIWLPKEFTDNLPFPFLAPVLGGRMTHLCKSSNEWFDLEANNSDYELKDNEMSEQIKSTIINCLLPFLEKIKKLEDIIPLLHEDENTTHQWAVPHTGGQTKEFLAIIYYILGNKNKSMEIIDEGIAKSEVKSFAERMEKLKQEILNT